ncbi:unnamed protein product, partial [Choristocarpus tenellus]
LLQSVVVSFLLAIWTQEFHRYSHMTAPPPLVVALQDAGLLISRRVHGMHHSTPFEHSYCIVSGLCNRVGERGRFRLLERVIYELNGEEPNSWKLDPRVKEASLGRQA